MPPGTCASALDGCAQSHGFVVPFVKHSRDRYPESGRLVSAFGVAASPHCQLRLHNDRRIETTALAAGGCRGRFETDLDGADAGTGRHQLPRTAACIAVADDRSA